MNAERRLGWLSMALVCGASLGLTGCTGYAPGAKAYWDARVRELCENDGGVVVYEQIRLSKSDIERRVLPIGSDGKIGVTVRNLAHPEAPVYAERSSVVLNEGEPQVTRVQWTVLRRADGAVVARWITYGRTGGDFPTVIAHPSGYSCPDAATIRTELQRLFIVGGSD